MAPLRGRLCIKPETGGVVELDGLHSAVIRLHRLALGDMTYVVSPAVTR
jgi:hypothetical protein